MTDAAPKRIWVSAPNEDNEVETWTDPDEGGTEYILATPEALAASPEVAALIAEARREGWNAAIEAANWLGLTFYDKVPKGSLTSVTILEYREAIRALKETTHD